MQLMQPDLSTLQADFRATVLADIGADGTEPKPPEALLAAVNANGIPPERHLAIHRNHFATTLIDSLGGVFEATRALLRPEFFDAFAKHYVGHIHLPPRDCSNMVKHSRMRLPPHLD